MNIDGPKIRVAIPKRVRFDVFKRDKFTCQYCGKAAPDIVLHCDHIEPVATGGQNDLLNLITSCVDCNLGKGAVPLSSSATLDKQREVLADLEERRQQIEMMLQWRNELRNLDDDVVSRLCSKILDATGIEPNENGRALMRRWVNKYGASEILAAIDSSFDYYLKYGADEKPTEESWEKAYKKIPNAASLHRQEVSKPYIRRLLYVQGIIRKRTYAKRYNCVDYLEHLHVCGADLDQMEARAKTIKTIEDFEAPYDEWLASIGRPY
jgi:hypothetical protein